MLTFIKKIWEIKLVRFITVGTFNTLLDITLLIVILKITGFPTVVANSMSVSIAISVSYFLNHRIVFREAEGYSLRKYIRFFLVTGLGVILIQDTVIYIVTDRLWVINRSKTFLLFGHTLHSQTVEILVTKLCAVLVGLAWNFFLYKYIVFRNVEKEDKLVIG